MGIQIDGINNRVTTGDIVSQTGTFSSDVGIGGTLTYEDVANIDSVGVITARSDISIADKIIHTGDTNCAIRFPATDTITAETGGTERLRIASDGSISATNNLEVNGQVGITSIIPASKFTVKGGSIFVGDNNMHGGSAGVIEYGGNTGHFDLKSYSMGGQTTIRMFTSLSGTNSERLRITNTGQLLLGSTSSANSGYKLESYSGGAYNIMAKSTNGNGGYHNFTGQASNGTITSYITHNGRGYFEDGVQFDSGGEVLDSYEEGSFTLSAVAAGSGTLTLNSSYNTGVYTRIGNLVKIQAYLSFSGNNNATGYVQLSSLPFTVDSNQAQASGHVRAVQVVYLNGQYAYLPDGAGYYNAQLYCNEGQTWIRIYDLNGSGRRIDTIARHLSGGADVFLNFSYLAA